MARGDSLQQTLLEQHGRKFFIQKIATTATTAVSTTISTTDDAGNTIPPGATIVIQPIGTDIYYAFQKAGAVTAITPASGSHPGVYVVDKQQEITTRLGQTGGGTTLLPGADAKIDIYPVSSANVLLFWMV